MRTTTDRPSGRPPATRRHALAQRASLTLAATAYIVLAASGAAAAPLAIPDVPVFLTAGGVDPNIMLMLDSSGSMRNVVPDVPYSKTGTYDCSSAAGDTVLGTDDQVDIYIRHSDNVAMFEYDGRFYDWGRGNNSEGSTTRSRRCFNPELTYLARLSATQTVYIDIDRNNGDESNDADDVDTEDNRYDVSYQRASDYLPARYTGHYLNWYFGTDTTNAYRNRTYSFGNRAIKPNQKNRMTIAQTAATNLLDRMDVDMRVGLAKYNGNDGGLLLDGVGELNATKKASLKTAISGIAAAGNTPLSETLSDIGYYYSRGATDLTLHPNDAAKKTTVSRTEVFNNGYTRNNSWDNGSDPIQYSCQKSFAVLLTDGRPQDDRGISAHLADYDGDCAARAADSTVADCDTHDRKPDQEYESAGSDYLDDVAMALYDMDLRPELTSDLGVKNNVATYIITFADYQAENDPLMPRAAKQGGSEKSYKAGDEAGLTAAFSAVLDSISSQGASAASAAVNSGSIGTTTRLYQAKFASDDWTGQLLAHNVNTNGTLGSVAWNAATLIPAPADRKIITVNSSGVGVAFQEAALINDPARMRQLDTAYTTANSALAKARLAYLRGDTSQEGTTTTHKFRKREGKLGDIVNSAPLFVGPPQLGYKDSLEAEKYSDFRLDNDQRKEVLYVGANDGMLHAFDAGSGAELLAFIPGTVFGNLSGLSSSSFTHKFFVDAPPNAGDVYIDDDWQTVLLGGLQQGGQGIYALNITKPGQFSEANAANIFMWEFTDRDSNTSDTKITGDADLGFTHSQPAIVRLQNGKWGAIFGNGYNNTVEDGAKSTTGNAVLYVVDIETGERIAKIDTMQGTTQDPTKKSRPNGLSTPAVVDINNDDKVDYVFAGDLFGNLWKFDIRDNDPDKWQIAFGTKNAPQPLFQAIGPTKLAQPITSRPEVIRGPRGVGMMVLFGTGKYLETTDTAIDDKNEEVQTYYGLFDRNSGSEGDRIEGLSDMNGQTIIEERSLTVGSKKVNLRLTSQTPLGNAEGWYLNLRSPSAYQGERVVANTVVRSGRVIFTTLIPNSDPCGFGGKSWLMELDALSGARLTTTPFDVNNDGVFDAKDLEKLADNSTVAVSGIQDPTAGILPTPGVLMSDDGSKEFKYSPGSDGNISMTVEDPGQGARGRQSWRQIR